MKLLCAIFTTIQLPDWCVAVVRNLDAHQGFWLVSLTFALVMIGLATCIVATRNDKRRSRPYVVLETVPGVFLGVRMSNIGLTPAQDVRVTSTPTIRIAFDRYKHDISFMSKGVAYLPPRAKFETYIGTFDDLRKECGGMVYKGMISYKDDAGRRYSENFILDYSLYEGLTGTQESDIARRIRECKDELHLLCSGFYKPHVLVDEHEKYEARIMAAIQEAQKEMTAHEAQPMVENVSPSSNKANPEMN